MNIVKLQDDLKGVPDQSLIGYVQNPTGQVPTYLALSELNRRKKMREQSSSAQAEGPQPSVAEQLVSEAQPQGIAELPVSNVGNEESYAAGGIVAFEEGGNVPSYADGRRVSSSEAYGLEQDRAEKERELYYAYIKDGILSRTGTPDSWRYAISGGHLGSPYKPATPGAEAGYKKQLETQADAINRVKYADSPTNTPMVMAPEQPNQAQMMANMEAAKLRKGLADGKYKETDLYSGIVTDKFKPPPVPNDTATTISQPKNIDQLTFNPMTDRSGEIDIPEEVDPRTAMEKYKGLVGVNPFQAKAEAKLAAMEAGNAKYGEQMPWMALAEAGLAIAGGKSPNALSNIAEGGMKGVTAYKAGQDKIRDVEDKIFNAQAKVAEAQRAEDIAAAKYGVDSEEAAKAAGRVAKTKRLEYKTKLEADNTAGKLKADEFNLGQKFDYDKLEQQERATNKRLKIQLAAAERQATSTDQKLEIASIRSAVSSAQTNVVSARRSYDEAKKLGDATALVYAKDDLDSALNDLKYYQGLATQNISNDTPPKLSDKAMKYLK